MVEYQQQHYFHINILYYLYDFHRREVQYEYNINLNSTSGVTEEVPLDRKQ